MIVWRAALAIAAVTVVNGNPASYSTPASSLLSLLGLPQCLVDCSGQLLLAVDDVIANRISLELYDQTCSAYTSAVTCLYRNNNNSSAPDSDCSAHFPLFEDLTSGLHYACVEEADAFRNFLPCVEATVTRRRREQIVDCESECHLNESISALTSSPEVKAGLLEGGGAFSLLPHAADVCTSLACYLKCSRVETNKHCGSSGSRLVEMAIRPFDRLLLHLRDATPTTHDFIRNVMPRQCRQFLVPKTLDDLRFDEDFLAKMRILMATRKRQEISSNYAEGDRVIKELLLPPSPARHGRPAPSWDTEAILYVIFMALTMLLVVTGLIISVIWCCRGDQAELASMRHFQPHLHKEQVRVIFNAGQQRLEEEEEVGGASSNGAAGPADPSLASRKRE